MRETYNYKIARKYIKTMPFENRLNQIIATETTIRKEKINGRWHKKSEKKQEITGEYYLNVIDAIEFFEGLGGTEKPTYNYTKYGKVIIELKSTSPDNEKMTIRKYEFL